MSKLLRLPFCLLAVLALFLLSPGIASAGENDAPACPTDSAPDGCPATAAGEQATDQDPLGDVTSQPEDSTTPPAPEDDGALKATGVMGDVADALAANDPTGTTTQGTDDGTTGTDTGTETTPPAAPGSDSPDPAAVGACIGAVIQQLITDLQGAVGDGVDGLIADIQDALADPTQLPAFLEGLPDMGDATVSGITDEGKALLTKAGEDIQACIPAPPSGGSTTPPPSTTPPTEQPAQPVSNEQPPPAAAPPATTPVPTAQPTQTLAYTGFDGWGLVRLSLILVSGGTLVLLAGVRRPA